MSRRTGATLKDTGIRDEHGLEPVPTFSSPAKSPVKQNGVPNSSLGDETMDIGESTIRTTAHSRLRLGMTDHIFQVLFPSLQKCAGCEQATSNFPSLKQRRQDGPTSVHRLDVL